MGNVDVLGTELARHALGQRAQAELADREIDEIGAATHRRRGAGEQDSAPPGLQHGARRRPADQKAAHAIGLPAGFEFLGRGLKHRAANEHPGVENHHARRARIGRDLAEQALDGVFIRGVAFVASRRATGARNRFHDRIARCGRARRHRHRHAGGREPPRQSRPQPGPHAND